MNALNTGVFGQTWQAKAKGAQRVKEGTTGESFWLHLVGRCGTTRTYRGRASGFGWRWTTLPITWSEMYLLQKTELFGSSMQDKTETQQWTTKICELSINCQHLLDECKPFPRTLIQGLSSPYDADTFTELWWEMYGTRPWTGMSTFALGNPCGVSMVNGVYPLVCDSPRNLIGARNFADWRPWWEGYGGLRASRTNVLLCVTSLLLICNSIEKVRFMPSSSLAQLAALCFFSS